MMKRLALILILFHIANAKGYIWKEVANNVLIDHNIEQTTLYLKATHPAPSRVWFHVTKNGVGFAGIDIETRTSASVIDIGYCTLNDRLPATESDNGVWLWAFRKSATWVKVWRDGVLVYSYEFKNTDIGPNCESKWPGDDVTDGILFNDASSPGIYIGTLVGKLSVATNGSSYYVDLGWGLKIVNLSKMGQDLW
eukprot:sb/3470928/